MTQDDTNNTPKSGASPLKKPSKVGLIAKKKRTRPATQKEDPQQPTKPPQLSRRAPSPVTITARKKKKS